MNGTESVQYLIPRVAVEPLLQPLLVERMANQAYGPRQHEQTIQVANLHNVLDLGLRMHGLAGKGQAKPR